MTAPSASSIALQRAHLLAVITWAEKIRGKLQPLLDAQGRPVHVGPPPGGVSSVGPPHPRPPRARRARRRSSPWQTRGRTLITLPDAWVFP
jgi:hypothetical protein